MPLIQGLYRSSTQPVVDHVVREPGPAQSLVYARSPSKQPAPSTAIDLASHLTEMLRRGEDRATALIQTLVANRSTSGLMSALERDPSLVNASMLLTLADCNARQEFGAALRLRPEAVTSDLLLDLGERKAPHRWLSLALHARPDLQHPHGPESAE